MQCEICGLSNASRCPACGRVLCPDHGAPDCPHCGCGVRAGRAPPREMRMTAEPSAPPFETGERVCLICGAPAAGACVRCGAWYCVRHRGVEALPDEPFKEGEVEPRICWNCRLASNARVVLFWVVLGALGLGALLAFFALWS